MANFTQKTETYMSGLSLETRKSLGQYMTPNFLGYKMASRLILKEGDKVLDPAVGTGELLKAVNDVFPNQTFELHGWDVDSGMLTVAEENIKGLNTLNRSIFDNIPAALLNSFDAIIANPPYFELKKGNPDVIKLNFETKYEAGRVNIYSLFFEYALKLLKPGGKLVFLNPPSMNNGAYFKQLRKYILTNSVIKGIEIVRKNNHFGDALTSVQIIVLEKTTSGYEKNFTKSSKYVVDFNKLSQAKNNSLPIIFTDKKRTILKAWRGRKSLTNLGFKVFTGRVVWNKHRNDFVPSTQLNSAPLLYAKDISKKNILEYKETLNSRRFLLTNNIKPQTVPSIIINRIVGSLENPNIRYAKIVLPVYYTENHVNVIEPTEHVLISLNLLKKRLQENSKWLPEYLQAITGNTQLSGKELANLIPF